MNNEFKLIRDQMKGKLIAPFLIGSIISLYILGLTPSAKAYASDEISMKTEALGVKSKIDLLTEIRYGLIYINLAAKESLLDPNVVEPKIKSSALKVYNNWNACSACSEIDYETVVEIIKCLNGYPSTISINDADAIISLKIDEMRDYAQVNASTIEQLYNCSLNISDLLLDNNLAVRDMESYFNGILQDVGNSQRYCENSLTDLVNVSCIADPHYDMKGIGLCDGDASTRLLWARLASAMVDVIGSYDEETMVKLPDSFNRETYFPYKMIKDANLFEQMAIVAEKNIDTTHSLI